ncbi:MAG: hypothetical protein NXI24_18990 [bacterium]|nr:hypothetical protein [bacterium]
MSHPESSNPESEAAAVDAPEQTDARQSERGRPAQRFFDRAVFWARAVAGPVVAPLLMLFGWGYADPALPVPMEFAGLMLFAWLLALLAGIGGLRWLAGVGLGSRGRSPDTKDLAAVYTGGRLLFLGAQLLYLIMLMPVGPGGAFYWGSAVAAAFVLMLVLRAPAYWNPATTVLVLITLASTVWPQEIFSESLIGGGAARSCVPAGLNLYGGCLLAELAPAAMILQVLLLLLLHFRRHAPGAAVLVALGGLLMQLGVSELQIEGFLVLTAVVLFLPGQPYRSAAQQLLRGLLWGAGLTAFFFLAGPAGLSEAASGARMDLLYPAWLAGLLFSEVAAASLRGLGLHL